MGGVMVVGAHPDDIEIGAGGTVAVLTRLGVEVDAVIASDEDDPAIAAVRRAETRRALSHLGIADDNVMFLGLRDRSVDRDDGLRAMTLLLSGAATGPDVVMTHSEHDQHSDHRSVACFVRTAVAHERLVLGMAVVNSLSVDFSPKLRIDTTGAIEAKAAALSEHHSQIARDRIRFTEIELFERRHADDTIAERVESFEVSRRPDAAALQILGSLSHWCDPLPVGGTQSRIR